MAASKGKGKGPGAGKGGPPPPPKAGSGPPKGKAQGGFAPNMRAPGSEKVNGWIYVIAGAKVQLEDGSLSPDSFCTSLKQYAHGQHVEEVVDTLLKEDKLFCTAAFVKCFDLLVNSDSFQKGYTETMVTKMGDGRDVEAETETKVVKRSAEEAIATIGSHSPLGEKMLVEAETFIAANTLDGNKEDAAREWIANTITFDYNVPKGRKEISQEEKDRRDAERRQKSMEEEKERQRCFAHWQSLAPASIFDVPWASCQSTLHAGGGSGGCVLAELEGGRAICLKPQGMHAVAEFFAEQLFKALGVQVASCRVVAWTDDEFHAITESVLGAPVMIEGHEANVRRVLTGISPSRNDSALAGGEDLSAEFVCVLEFVPGHGLMGIQARDALAAEDVEQIYQGIGQICAVDALINNFDRVPLPLWSNDGNLSNVMVSAGRAVAIDQQVNIIVEGPGRDAYLTKLRALIEDSMAGASSKAAASIKQALLENAGTEPSDASLEGVMTNLRQGFERCAELWHSGALEKLLVEIEESGKARFDIASTDVGQTRIEAMTSFVRSTAAEVATAIGTSGS